MLQEALAWRGRLVVLLLHLGPLTRLGLELERRLEVIHIQSQGLIELPENLSCNDPRETLVAHDSPNDGAILLLDPGLVVLLIGPRARERKLLFLAVSQQRLVDE